MNDYIIDSCLFHPEIKCELVLEGVCDCHLCIPSLCDGLDPKKKVLEVVA